MTLHISRLLAMTALVACLATAAACELPGRNGAVIGEVRFAREVTLPENSVVTVKLLDSSYADAPSPELGRDVIENANRLPIRFRIEYDRTGSPIATSTRSVPPSDVVMTCST